MEEPASNLLSVDTLLASLMAEQLDASGWERLEQILLTDAAARSKYIDLISLDVLLYWDGSGARDLAALRQTDAVSLEQSGVTPNSMDDAALLPAIKEVESDEADPTIHLLRLAVAD